MMKAQALSVLVLGFAVACGGSSGGGGEASSANTETIPSNAARTAGGEAIRTAEGAAVTKKAHSRWESALSDFRKNDRDGWTDAECGTVSRSFERAASAQDGDFAEATYMSGLTRARCGDNKSAEEAYVRALSKNPKFCKARVALGLRDLRNGDAQAARRAFEQSIKDDPQCTSGYTNLAILQRKAGGKQEAEALKNLRRALAIESDYLPAFNQMALLHHARGKRGSRGKESGRAELDLAEVVCRQAQLIDPNYAPIYNTWGLIKMTQGDVIEALRFFEKAISLDPTLFEAQMNFGSVTISFRGYEDGQRAFAKAADLRPQSYDAAIGLGTSLRGLQRYNEAQAQYERAKKLNANRPEAYFNLGVLYQDYMSGSVADLQRAKSYFQGFLSRAGSRPGYSDTVRAVNDRCKVQRRRARGRTKCRPGRLQNIETTIAALQGAS